MATAERVVVLATKFFNIQSLSGVREQSKHYTVMHRGHNVKCHVTFCLQEAPTSDKTVELNTANDYKTTKWLIYETHAVRNAIRTQNIQDLYL